MPVWIVALAVLGAAGGIAVLDEEAGIGTWLALRAESRIASERIERVEGEVERLASEIAELDADALGLERAIREDLELARPGEWVVRFAAATPSTKRITRATSRFP